MQLEQMKRMIDLSVEQKKHGFEDSASQTMSQETVSLEQGNNEYSLELRRVKTVLRNQADVINSMKEAINELIAEINDLKAFRKRLVQGSPSTSQGSLPSAPATHPRTGNFSPDKPIDRNGVAPASVKIEDIFYCGNKR